MPRGFDVESGSDLSLRLKGFVLRLENYLKGKRDEDIVTPASPIPAKAICSWAQSYHLVTISDADIRAMVNYLRREKKPIASSSHGYFWAVNPHELEPTILHMEDRIMGIRAAKEGLESAEFDEPRLL